MITQQDEVAVHYVGTIRDGVIFDQTQEEPLRTDLAKNEIIPGFKEALIGMEEGEEKTFTVEPKEAYGKHRDDLIVAMDRDQVPEEVDVAVGLQMNLRLDSGAKVPVLVEEVKEDEIIVDANHPLAGETLTFDVEVVDVNEA